MKTTLELPDDLMLRVRLRAERHKRKLKDEIAESSPANVSPCAE